MLVVATRDREDDPAWTEFLLQHRSQRPKIIRRRFAREHDMPGRIQRELERAEHLRLRMRRGTPLRAESLDRLPPALAISFGRRRRRSLKNRPEPKQVHRRHRAGRRLGAVVVLLQPQHDARIAQPRN